MDKCEHHKFQSGGEGESSLLTVSIRISEMMNFNCSTKDFVMKNGCEYAASLFCSQDIFTFKIISEAVNLKCSVSMFIGSETPLFSNSLNAKSRTETNFTPHCSYYDLVVLLAEDERYKKLRQHPNDTIVIVCGIIHPPSRYAVMTPAGISTESMNYLKRLGAALRNSSELSQEKVVLQVGEETETVSKSVLCALSPVFTRMFQNDMRELKENVVTVTDIKMPVIKGLVSFLYSGKVSICKFDFLCDLYYAADKYDMTELRQLCLDLLLPQISMKNIFRALKLAVTHNIEWLKLAVMTFMSANIETVASTSDWRNLINDEPNIAVEILNLK